MFYRATPSVTKALRTRFSKIIARNLLALFLLQLIGSSIPSYALTSGPGQPEAAQFTPVGGSNLVDPFTGDFSYSIPLLEVPGPNGSYPFALGYNAGITMDQESSWVGLGWNLNAGAIIRNMRGLPDEFNGDKIKVEQDMKANTTITATGELDKEIWGFAGLDPDIITDDLDKDLQIKPSLSLFYNSYNGFGYSIDASIALGLNHTGPGSSNLNAGLGLNSQEGFSFNAGYSIHSKSANQGHNANVSSHYSARNGLTSLSLGFGLSKNIKNWNYSTGSQGNFITSSFLPEMARPMTTIGGNLKFKHGIAGAGFFKNYSIKGSFSTQKFRDKNFTRKAYGYNSLDKYDGTKEDHVADFNKSSKVILTKRTSHLSPSHLTYDTYSISGQGIGGSFRPHRDKIGVVHSPKQRSTSNAAGAGAEISIPGTKFGFNGNYRRVTQNTGAWDNSKGKNEAYGTFGFEGPNEEGEEGYYYKLSNEMSARETASFDHIGGPDWNYFDLNKNGKRLENRLRSHDTYSFSEAWGSFFDGNGHKKIAVSESEIANGYSDGDTRNSRGTSIIEIKNKDINSALPNLPELAVDIYTSAPTTGTFVDLENLKSTVSRTSHPDDHNAAFVVTKPSGSRYIYGLPVYNNEHIEHQFTVDYNKKEGELAPLDIVDEKINYEIKKTNKYNFKRTLPKYVHSHLITSVLGSDYVDLDSEVGPSDGDAGYWTKFGYTQTSNDYNWRAPFYESNFIGGKAVSHEDDQGSYMFGQKEVNYLTTVETKTHIAVFKISKREDGYGPSKRLQKKNDALDLSNPLYKLDEINLYVKSEFKNNVNAVPLKTVHFAYNYDLCPNVPNNSGLSVEDADGNELNAIYGKLTLKKVWFTYGNNTRGEQTPYAFSYGQEDDNPNYELQMVDRWGYYQRNDSHGNLEDIQEYNTRFPYVDHSLSRETIDQQKASWSLRSIDMPSGSTLTIDYESDDYSYVQNRKATRMYPIAWLDDADNYEDDVRTYEDDDAKKGSKFSKSQRSVCFKLNEAIDNTTDAKKLAKSHYFGDLSNEVYFKLDLNIHDSESSNAFTEVNGFSEYEETGFFASSEAATDKLDMGYIKLKGFTDKNYHPFSVAGWQYMKIQAPLLISKTKNFTIDEGDGDGKQKSSMKNLVGFGKDIIRIFTGFYNYCSTHDFSRAADLNESFIRLNCGPTETKIGGGIRVKQITITDNWDKQSNESAAEYGQVYHYDNNGVSYGVASYEPIIGGDENPMRNRIENEIKVPLSTNYKINFESPINEHLIPGATVGYSKVRMTSLATDNKMKATQAEAVGFDMYEDIMTTGAVEHEFYTAKDYPMILVEDDAVTSYINIPAILFAGTSTFAGSQGYYTEFNDMHGKPKKTSSFEQYPDGSFSEEAYAYTEYKYKEHAHYPGYISSQVEVMTGSTEHAPMFLGLEYDVTIAMSQEVIKSTDLGLDVGLEKTTPLPPDVVWVPEVSPQFGYQQTNVRTAVLNKVVHRTGLLDRIIVNDGQASTTTQNEVYDPISGQAILTSINNNFDDDIFSLNMLAYHEYDGMGPAYKNAGLRFNALTLHQNNKNQTITLEVSEDALSNLTPGDELICPHGKLIFETKINVNEGLFTNVYQNDFPYAFSLLLSHSGRRNMLSASAQAITTLQTNPLDDLGLGEECSKTYSIPQSNGVELNNTSDFPVAYVNYVLKNAIEYFADLPLSTLHKNYSESRAEDRPLVFDFDKFSQVPDFYNPSKHWTDRDGFEIDAIGLSRRPLFENRVWDHDWNRIRTHWSGSCESTPRSNSEYEYSLFWYSSENATASYKLEDRNGWAFTNNDGNLVDQVFAINYDNETTNVFSDIDTDNLDFGVKLTPDKTAVTQINLPLSSTADTYFRRNGKAEFSGYNYRFDDYHLIRGENPSPGTAAWICETKAFRDLQAKDYLTETTLPDILECKPDYDLNPFHGIHPNYLRPNDYIEWTSGSTNLYTVNNQTINFTKKELDNVLSISAISFTDNHNNRDVIYKHGDPNSVSSSAFVSAEKGVWRPNSSYVYINEEKNRIENNETLKTQTVDLKNDGAIDEVVIFDHHNPFFTSCEPKWRKINEVTKYNVLGYEIENKDALDVHSTALHDFKGTKAIAAATNSKSNELLTEGFESYGEETMLLEAERQFTGNFDLLFFNHHALFGNNISATPLISLDVESANGPLLLVDQTTSEVDEVLAIGDVVQVYGYSLQDYSEKIISGSVEVTGIAAQGNKSIIKIEGIRFLDDELWSGQLLTSKEKEITQFRGPLASYFSNEKAHSGAISLRVVGSTLQEQIRFQPTPGKKQLLSCWLSMDDNIEEKVASLSGNDLNNCLINNIPLADPTFEYFNDNSEKFHHWDKAFDLPSGDTDWSLTEEGATYFVQPQISTSSSNDKIYGRPLIQAYPITAGVSYNVFIDYTLNGASNSPERVHIVAGNFDSQEPLFNESILWRTNQNLVFNENYDWIGVQVVRPLNNLTAGTTIRSIDINPVSTVTNTVCTSFSDPVIKLNFLDDQGNLISGFQALPVTDKISGWQKFEVLTDEIPEYTTITIELISPIVNGDYLPLYVDDIRISPLNSGMQSYVYEPETERLAATLDANNFATFYYYDRSGALHLVKRETEQGIVTISETRAHTAIITD